MESDIIGHLVDVEHKASTLLDNAKKEAQIRVDEAKVTADKQYSVEYKKIIVDFENDYAQKTKALNKTYKEAIKKYTEKTENLSQDAEAFNNLLDKLLLEA